MQIYFSWRLRLGYGALEEGAMNPTFLVWLPQILGPIFLVDIWSSEILSWLL